MRDATHQVLVRYGIAAASVIAATGLRLSLNPVLEYRFPFATLFFAVLVSAWYGGLGPALLAAVLGGLASVWFLLPPTQSWMVEGLENQGGLALYFAVSVGIALIGGAMRKAQQRSEQAARQLAAQQENLRVTLQSIGDAVIATDVDGRITALNMVATTLTGWPQPEAHGRPLGEVFQIINEQTRQPVENPVRKVLAEGRTIGLANHSVLITRSGQSVPIDDSAAPIRDNQGKLLGVVLVFRDVSERRQAQESLKQSAQELSDFFENANVGLHWVGPAGTIVRVNQAQLDLLGYGREEYVGHAVAEFHVDREVSDDILKRLAAGETLQSYPARLRCRDGLIKHVLINSSVRWDQGRFVHSRCFTLDVTDRLQAEEARALLAAIVASSDDAIISKSLDGIITSWNQGAERLFGYAAAEALGQPITLIIPPDRRDEERLFLERLRRGERIDQVETVRVAKKGTPIDISLTMSPILDPAGRIIGASKVARDLRARKRAEERLLEELRVIEALNRVATLLVAERSLPRVVQAVTDEATRMAEAQFGAFFLNVRDERGESYALYTISGAPCQALDRFPMPRNTAIFEPTFRGQGVLRLADVTQDPRYGKNPPYQGMPEGHLPVKSYLAVPVISSTGAVLGGLFLGHARAGVFSERHEQLVVAAAAQAAIAIENARLDEELRESEEKFRTLADNMAQLAWMCDRLGLATWYNRRWYDYTGATFEQVRGEGWKQFHHPDHLDRVVAKLQDCLERGQVWEDTFPLRGKDGRYRWFLSRAVPIRAESGQVICWFGTSTDITAQRQAEEALREADQRKDQFLATLAHELRNPLAPVRNSLEIMKLAKGDAKVIDQARATIDRQMTHLERLVDDLLDISRISRDRLELRKQWVELGSAIRHAVEAGRPLLEFMRQELKLELPAEPVYLDADPVRLAQVFSNLLNNACKYTESGGRIELAARPVESEVVVTVQDSGIGIPPELLPDVFDMFTQVEHGSGRSQGGLGIGLTLVRRLVELHGGSVQAQSDGIGKGSRFEVRLPILSDPPALPPSPSAAEPSAAGRRILIVDDNHDAAETLAKLLQISGHETHLAHDGLAAVEAAAALRPDVILLDLGLPRLSGHDAAARIRAQPWGKSLKLIALTGWGQDEDRRKSKEVGFDHHLVKPVDPTALMSLIASLAVDRE